MAAKAIQCPPFTALMVTHAGDKSAFLRKALQSLQDQTLRPAETVLICSGPLSDAHISVIAEHSGALNIKRVDLRRNRPLGFSLNVGLRIASSQWVARMDADVICVPDSYLR